MEFKKLFKKPTVKKGKENASEKQKQKLKQQNSSANISIFTLNVNGLNTKIKRQTLVEWIQKHDPTKGCLQEIQFKCNNTSKLKVKRWKEIYEANINQRKS